jgi:pyruvate formate lyase activating enzyme
MSDFTQSPGTPILDPTSSDARFLQEARFWEPLSQHKLRCLLCPHACIVLPGALGYCGVRENRDGVLHTLVYSRICAANVDPIEKKPLFHFLPGTAALSIATAGCNLTCNFCQNADIAHPAPGQIPGQYIPPAEIVRLALANGCPSIAFTYTEPTIFAEFLMDTAEAARSVGLRTVAISNGFIQPEALHQVFSLLDAVKVDLKAFNPRFYREVAGARLEPVLDTLVSLRSLGKWIEIVNLILPTLNDSEVEIRQMSQWIYQNLGPDIPLHFTRFHPDHQMRHLSATPVATLELARQIALAEGLHYVYIGNVPGHPAQNTYCPGCNQSVIERVGFSATRIHLTAANTCSGCDYPIPGVWQT